MFRVLGPLLPLCIWKTGTQQTATPRVLMVMAVVDVVYEGIVLDGILWSPFPEHRVVGFHTEFAERILTVVADPFVLIAIPTQPILQHHGRELLQGFVVMTFRALVSPRRIVCHVNLALQEFTAYAELFCVVYLSCVDCC